MSKKTFKFTEIHPNAADLMAAFGGTMSIGGSAWTPPAIVEPDKWLLEKVAAGKIVFKNLTTNDRVAHRVNLDNPETAASYEKMKLIVGRKFTLTPKLNLNFGKKDTGTMDFVGTPLPEK